MHRESASTGIPRCEGLVRADETSLRVAGDQGWASYRPAAVADLALAPHQTDPSPQADRESFCLSQEEHRIAALILTGYSNKDMAHHFSLSQSTIHRRIARVLAKVGLRNNIELVFLMMTRQFPAGAQP